MFFRAINFVDINVRIAMVRLLLFFSCAFTVSYFVFLELCFFYRGDESNSLATCCFLSGFLLKKSV